MFLVSGLYLVVYHDKKGKEKSTHFAGTDVDDILRQFDEWIEQENRDRDRPISVIRLSPNIVLETT